MKDKNDPRWLTKEYRRQQSEYDRQKNTVNPRGYEARGGTEPYVSRPMGDPSFEKKRARARIDQEELASMEAENQLQDLREEVNLAKGTPYYDEMKRRLAFAERGVMKRRQQSARAREEYANLPEPPKFADIRQQMIYEQAAARGMQQGFSPETVERALRAGKTLLFPK